MGRGIVIIRGKTHPVQIDDEARPVLIPCDYVANTRVLPDDFDAEDIRVCFKGNGAGVKVEGAPDAWLSELGEG